MNVQVLAGWRKPNAAARVAARAALRPPTRSMSRMSRAGTTRSLRSAGAAASGDAEPMVSLKELIRLKGVFEEVADENGELSLEVFTDNFAKVFGADKTELELRCLFMKIDANGNGGVDWGEFSTYLLAEQESRQRATENFDGAKLVTAPLLDHNVQSAVHRGMIRCALHASEIIKYLSFGDDGSIKVWEPTTLEVTRSATVGRAGASTPLYISDACFDGSSNTLVTVSDDRCVRVLDIRNFAVKSKVPELPSCPRSVAIWRPFGMEDDGMLLAFGDEHGDIRVNHLNADATEIRFLHSVHGHDDWVSRIRHLPELTAVVSTGLDGRAVLYDERLQEVRKVLVGIRGPVYDVLWCPRQEFLITCGIDRDLHVWSPYRTAPLYELKGHKSSIVQLALDSKRDRLFSLGSDKSIKVWDLRRSTCVQTVVEDARHRPIDALTVMFFDEKRDVLVTGCSRLQLWPLQIEGQDQLAAGSASSSPLGRRHVRLVQRVSSGIHKSHPTKVVSALFNRQFGQVVSCSEEDVVIWMLDSGKRSVKFQSLHAGRITCLRADAAGRRLLCSSSDGVIKLLNANTGMTMKRLVYDERLEISCVNFVEQARGSDVAPAKAFVGGGWSRALLVWPEDDDPTVTQSADRRLTEHVEDIQSSAFDARSGTVLTGSYDGQLIVWNALSFAVMARQTLFGASTDVAARSIDAIAVLQAGGETVVVCSGQRNFVTMFRLSLFFGSGFLSSRVASVPLPSTKDTATSLAACSHDADGLVCVGTATGTLLLYRVVVPPAADAPLVVTRLRELKHTPTSPITSCDVWPEQKVLLSGAFDGSVTLWNLSGERIGMFGQDKWRLSAIQAATGDVDLSTGVLVHGGGGGGSSSAAAAAAASTSEGAGASDAPASAGPSGEAAGETLGGPLPHGGDEGRASSASSKEEPGASASMEWRASEWLLAQTSPFAPKLNVRPKQTGQMALIFARNEAIDERRAAEYAYKSVIVGRARRSPYKLS